MGTPHSDGYPPQQQVPPHSDGHQLLWKRQPLCWVRSAACFDSSAGVSAELFPTVCSVLRVGDLGSDLCDNRSTVWTFVETESGSPWAGGAGLSRGELAHAACTPAHHLAVGSASSSGRDVCVVVPAPGTVGPRPCASSRWS